MFFSPVETVLFYTDYKTCKAARHLNRYDPPFASSSELYLALWRCVEMADQALASIFQPIHTFWFKYTLTG